MPPTSLLSTNLPLLAYFHLFAMPSKLPPARPIHPIPTIQFPHRPATYLVLLWFILCLLLILPPSLSTSLLDHIPFSKAHLRLAAKFTFILHSFEALYAAFLLTRTRPTAATSHPSLVAAWIAQTACLGFPSLFLLMHKLALSPQ